MQHRAGDALEPFPVGGGHLGSPTLEAVDPGGPEDQGEHGQPILRTHDASVGPRAIAPQLGQSLRRALVIVEHDRVPGDVDERTNPLQDVLGIADEVFIPDLEVPVELMDLAPRLVDSGDPPARDLLDRIRTEPEVLYR